MKLGMFALFFYSVFICILYYFYGNVANISYEFDTNTKLHKHHEKNKSHDNDTILCEYFANTFA